MAYLDTIGLDGNETTEYISGVVKVGRRLTHVCSVDILKEK